MILLSKLSYKHFNSRIRNTCNNLQLLISNKWVNINNKLSSSQLPSNKLIKVLKPSLMTKRQSTCLNILPFIFKEFCKILAIWYLHKRRKKDSFWTLKWSKSFIRDRLICLMFRIKTIHLISFYNFRISVNNYFLF